MVHRLRDFDDLEQPTWSEMRVSLHHPQTLHKLQEVGLLGGSQRVLMKEWNNRPKKITPFRNNELIQMFSVIVESVITVDATRTEELLHHVQTLDALRALRHHKLMRYLETSFITPAIWSLGLSHDVDGKASFTVNKTSNPTDLDQSFLLIVRS
jgi:hypothetical protein